MKRHRASLGELCTLVKGISPIGKTPPGRYPLVTTGAARKSADTFQFNTEAVCIPLISSTGHGHASLKRVHHQTGKFALANLLAAALVKDRAALSPRFLARYLNYAKDRLIVPLMTGAANMSISIERLATVPVEFPPLAKQNRLVMLLDEADELRTQRNQADIAAATLVPALFYEMFGDPSSTDTRWPIVPLKTLGKVTTGNTPPRKNVNLFGNFIEWVKTDNIDATRGLVARATEGLSKEGALQGRIVPAGTVLVTCIAGSRERLGDAAVSDRDVAINQQINAITLNADSDSAFVCQQIGALKGIIQNRATGNMTGIINKTTLEAIPMICPPRPRQQQFAARVTQIRSLETKQSASRQRLDDLFHSMLHRAFNGEL